LIDYETPFSMRAIAYRLADARCAATTLATYYGI
jgi:hypothetical protein